MLSLLTLRTRGGENVNNNSFELDYNYDSSCDVLVVKVKRDFTYAKTVEMDEGVLLDFDINNVPISLEILDASKIFKVPKGSLNNPSSFNMKVCVNEDSIKIDVRMRLLNEYHHENTKLDSLVNNYANIPSMETTLSSV